MSTIKIKRTTGSSTPSGLTFGEPAYVQGLKSLYIGQTAGDPAIRIGAEVDTSISLGTSDNKIPTQNAVKSYVDSVVGGGAVGTINGLTGTVTIAGGTAISVSTASQTITIANTGVQSLAGTSNQISVSGSTGAVTLSLPSTVTVPGALNVTTNLTVTGNLTVNGTTTTVNSDVMTVDDPVIMLGLSGGLPLTVSDGGKSKGIAYSWYDTANSTGKTGFFGIRNPDNAPTIFGAYQSVDLTSDTVGAGATLSGIETAGLYLRANQNTSVPFLHFLVSQSTSPSALGRVIYFADHAGYVMTPSTLGTPGYIIKANGLTAQPTWIDSNASGFTAFTSTNVLTASDTSDAETFIAFVPLASAANQGIRYNSGLTYNAVTNSVSATTFVGAFSGNATTASTLQTARTIGLTGDVSGSASFNGSADINITATIAANSVALGTDTSGNYLAQLTTTSTGLTVGGGIGEGISQTVNLTTITSGLNMEIFTFASGEFVNTSGTISLGTVDGGSY